MVTTNARGGAYHTMDMDIENLTHEAAGPFPDQTADLADES